MKILFFGDIVGKSGRAAIREFLPRLREEHSPDLVIANVENAAHGKGITTHTINTLLEAGVDFFTSGNHVFDKPQGKEVFERLDGQIIRPANFAADLPGKGWEIIEVNHIPVAVINLNGQVFMEKQFDYGEIKNPFLCLDEILNEIGDRAKIRLIDFHAEATSEKRAMGFFADGRVSAVLGTHTHIQTADAQVLPQGTGYIADLGMVGSANTVIGFMKENVMKRFLAGEEEMPAIKLEISEADEYEIGYAVLKIDDETGKCKNIKAVLSVRN